MVVVVIANVFEQHRMVSKKKRVLFDSGFFNLLYHKECCTHRSDRCSYNLLDGKNDTWFIFDTHIYLKEELS